MEFSILVRATLATVVAGLLFGCQATTTTLTPPKNDGVFIHISHGADDPHRLLMGLRMAEVMSSDKDVLVYFDIKGVGAVLKDAEVMPMEPFQSAQVQLQALLDKGVSIYVCPSCLAAAQATPDQLVDGIQIADKDAFFDFTEGRILTLDY